jgi:putative oxidoreductase
MANKLSNIALSLLRFVSGLMLAYFHGLGKVIGAFGYLVEGKEWRFINLVSNIGFPVPVIFALLSTFAEFVCGILLAIGFLTRYSALLVLINMTVVLYRHFTTDMRIELGALYFLIALLFVFKGGEGISIDGFIKRK